MTETYEKMLKKRNGIYSETHLTISVLYSLHRKTLNPFGYLLIPKIVHPLHNNVYTSSLTRVWALSEYCLCFHMLCT